MDYCTQQDMIDRFGNDEIIQLTDHDNAGVIDVVVLARALADASGEIDGYVSTRYSVPLANVTKTVNRIACDITRYYLHDEHPTELVEKRYDDAVKFLKGVSAGTISIGIDDAGGKPVSNDTVEFEPGSNAFDRKNSSDFI